jgi:filamentous hemagglutinin
MGARCNLLPVIEKLSQETGSRIDAGGVLAIAAGRDINARAAEISAGDALTAQAGRDSLTSGQNSERLSGSNKSSGGSVGVGISAGSGSAGFTVSASVNQSRTATAMI